MLVERLEVAEHPRDPLAATLLRLLVQRHIPSFWRDSIFDRAAQGAYTTEEKSPVPRSIEAALWDWRAALAFGPGYSAENRTAPQWARVKALLVLGALGSPHVVGRMTLALARPPGSRRPSRRRWRPAARRDLRTPFLGPSSRRFCEEALGSPRMCCPRPAALEGCPAGSGSTCGNPQDSASRRAGRGPYR